MSKTCRLFHDWGQWIDIKMTVRPALSKWPLQGTYTLYSDPIDVDGQKKICARCGKKKMRKI